MELFFIIQKHEILQTQNNSSYFQSYLKKNT